MLGLVAANSAQLNWGAFLILMMGISLVAMTIFLYPIFRKDSKELAVGMLLFRGALEGCYYLVGSLGLLTLVALGNEYAAAGAASAASAGAASVAATGLGCIGFTAAALGWAGLGSGLDGLPGTGAEASA